MKRRSDLEIWLAITQDLGIYADPAYLTAIAVKGFEVLGRGAVFIDRTHLAVAPVVYVNRAEFAESDINPVRKQACVQAINQYDPATQLIIVALEELEPPDYFNMTTLVMQQSRYLSDFNREAVSQIYRMGLLRAQVSVKRTVSFEQN